MNSDNANDTDRSVISAGSSLLDVTIATDASASTAHYSHNQYNQRSLSSRQQQQQQQQQQPPSIIRSPSIIKNSTNGRSGGNLSGLVVDAGGNNNTDNGSVNGRSRIDDDTTPMGTPNQTNRRSNSIISNWTQDLIENVYDTSVPFVPDLNNGNTNTNHCNDNTTAAMISLRETIGLGLRDVRDTNRRDFDRVFAALQQEALKRSALEQRLHSQLLLQSEAMVAMELKLLRLEARADPRDFPRIRSAGGGINTVGGLSGGSSIGIGKSHAPILPASTSLPPFDAAPDPPIPSSYTAVAAAVAHRRTLPTIDDGVDGLRHWDNDHEGPSPIMGGIPETMEIRVTDRMRFRAMSSGASIASAVTATSYLDGEGSTTMMMRDEDEDDDDGAGGRRGDTGVNDEGSDGASDDGDVEDEGEGSGRLGRNRTNLESILRVGGTTTATGVGSVIGGGGGWMSGVGASIRATRGDDDGSSTIATSVTNTTVASTVFTAATNRGSTGGGIDRGTGGGSVIIVGHDRTGEDGDDEGGSGSIRSDGMGRDVVVTRGRIVMDDAVEENEDGIEGTRSRSQSPLTVHSAATASIGTRSVASASVGVLSTAAVAPARSFRARRDAAGKIHHQQQQQPQQQQQQQQEEHPEQLRPLADRVVTFTSKDGSGSGSMPPVIAGEAVVSSTPPMMGGVNVVSGGFGSGGIDPGDSITMPDELDNFSVSDVADVFADRARVWREEYEARLDAVQKRFVGGE